MQKKDINIIIPVIGNAHWIGGLTYQENLIEALGTIPELCITLTNELDIIDLPQKKQAEPARLIFKAKKMVNGMVNRFSSWSKNYDSGLQHKLEGYLNGVTNAVFSLNEAHLRGKNNILKLYWIPDFQQMHLKHFFTNEDLAVRNARYREGCELADIIIVSSENARRDLMEFVPKYAKKCRVSRFVSNIPFYIWDANPMVTVSRYSLPEKFFYLPNQFWKHKNHIVVFKALEILRRENVFPNLVCTGNPNDHRDPEYYKNLMKQADHLGIKNQIRFLGMVPFEDVLILIRQSIAVINPSLFEGWSTTVEEAKSIGKQIILSDLDVHREQSPPGATYFQSEDATALAAILKSKWNELKPGPDETMEKEARRKLPFRMNEYASSFVNIISSFQRIQKVE